MPEPAARTDRALIEKPCLFLIEINFVIR